MKGNFEVLEKETTGNICLPGYLRTGKFVEVVYDPKCINEMFARCYCEEPRQQGTFRHNGQLLIGPVE